MRNVKFSEDVIASIFTWLKIVLICTQETTKTHWKKNYLMRDSTCAHVIAWKWRFERLGVALHNHMIVVVVQRILYNVVLVFVANTNTSVTKWF